MAKRNKSKDKVPAQTTPDAGPFNAAFAGLAALKADLGEAEPAPAAPKAAEPKATPKSDRASFGGERLPSRVVLQKEKKGHGGKTVTRVRKLDFGVTALDELAKALKRSLGCGARVEDGEILLQGDIADRAATWFSGQGVKQVVRSG